MWKTVQIVNLGCFDFEKCQQKSLLFIVTQVWRSSLWWNKQTASGELADVCYPDPSYIQTFDLHQSCCSWWLNLESLEVFLCDINIKYKIKVVSETLYFTFYLSSISRIEIHYCDWKLCWIPPRLWRWHRSHRECTWS